MKNLKKLVFLKAKVEFITKKIVSIGHLFREIEIELFTQLLLEDLNTKHKFLLILMEIIIELELLIL